MYSVHIIIAGVVVGEITEYRGRVEIGGVYSALSWCVHHNFVRDGRYSERGGRAPPPSPAMRQFFNLECSPESGRCHSVYSVGEILFIKIESAKPFVFHNLLTFGSTTNTKLAEHIINSIA
jgi:hypothetical protein